MSIFPRKDAVDEHDWLPAARRGEQWAIEQFFHCYQAPVFALCRRLLGRREDAEDATQTTFVRAFIALPKFRGGSQVKTWLYRIAVNEALSILRVRKNAPLLLDKPLNESLAGGDENISVQERLAVQRALNACKPDQRAILVLRFWQELSYEEIGEVLNLSLSAVKMRLSRARDRFQKAYEGQE